MMGLISKFEDSKFINICVKLCYSDPDPDSQVLMYSGADLEGGSPSARPL